MAHKVLTSKDPMAHKVLVLCGTGKVGRHTTLALKEAGFEVYATTRSSQNTSLASKGIKPIIANYTDRTDLDRALSESGAKKVLMITDYFLAANNSTDREFEQGKMMTEAACRNIEKGYICIPTRDAYICIPCCKIENPSFFFPAVVI
jgi:D-arabinose 1-dehydrogenase-like Zn-dependent alcohol dehydrogenase